MNENQECLSNGELYKTELIPFKKEIITNIVWLLLLIIEIIG